MEISSSNIENLFIETAGDLAVSLSINRVVGELYALLYINPEPVSLEEMSEKLKISKGSASLNIRILENWQAVKIVGIKGSRKDYYTAEPDFLKIVVERLHQGLSRRLDFANAQIEKAKTILNVRNGNKKSLNKNRDFYLQRVKKIEETCKFLQNALSFLPTITQLKKFPFFKLKF